MALGVKGPTVVGTDQLIPPYLALTELHLTMGTTVLQGVDLALAIPVKHQGLLPEGDGPGRRAQLLAQGHHIPVIEVRAQLPQNLGTSLRAGDGGEGLAI
jgi:hypothetical protein